MSVTEVSPHNGSLDWSIAASILRGTRLQLVGPDSWRAVSFRLSINLRYVQMSYVTGDLERFVDTMYRDNSIELLKLKGEILLHTTARCAGRYLTIVLDVATLAERKLPGHDLALLKNLPMEDSGVVVGVAIRINGDLCKVSLRCTGTFDMRLLAEQFSGPRT